MDQNELSFNPRHQGGPSGAAKKIPMPVVHSAQTVHLSCIEINSISKQTKAGFHLTHVTYLFHRVRSKRFLEYYMFGTNGAPILRHRD
jgi:hypothetical protein